MRTKKEQIGSGERWRVTREKICGKMMNEFVLAAGALFPLSTGLQVSVVPTFMVRPVYATGEVLRAFRNRKGRNFGGGCGVRDVFGAVGHEMVENCGRILPNVHECMLDHMWSARHRDECPRVVHWFRIGGEAGRGGVQEFARGVPPRNGRRWSMC